MTYELWADGACSKNGKEGAVGGWAFMIIQKGKGIITRQSGGEVGATNNQMEMRSIIEGLKYLTEQTPFTGFDECVIFTDSAYIHNCYDQKWYCSWQKYNWLNSQKKPVANKRLWQELIPYFENERFKWEKVRGHVGIAYNEEVDKMAVQARKKIQGEIENGHKHS